MVNGLEHGQTSASSCQPDEAIRDERLHLLAGGRHDTR